MLSNILGLFIRSSHFSWAQQDYTVGSQCWALSDTWEGQQVKDKKKTHEEQLKELGTFSFQKKSDLFTLSRCLNGNCNISFSWPSLASHEVGSVFLPATLQFHVLPLRLCPSDLGRTSRLRELVTNVFLLVALVRTHRRLNSRFGELESQH